MNLVLLVHMPLTKWEGDLDSLKSLKGLRVFIYLLASETLTTHFFWLMNHGYSEGFTFTPPSETLTTHFLVLMYHRYSEGFTSEITTE